MVTPIPYAITAGNVTGPVAASQMSGTIPLVQLPSAVVTNGASGVNLTGSFTGNFAGMTNDPSAIKSFRGFGTNTVFVDQSAPGSFLIFTNRAMLLPQMPAQTNSPSLYLVVTNQTLLQSIGFLDGSLISSGGPGRFAGLNWFPNHSGTEMEMTEDSPGSLAFGWCNESSIGNFLQPNRSLQIGITGGYGRLENIYIQGVFNSYALPNCGYSIPLSFNSGYTSNGIAVNQLMTLWAHATDTNGENRLTLYDNWDQSATPDLRSHNFSKSIVRAEFITASKGGTGGMLVNGTLTVNGQISIAGNTFGGYVPVAHIASYTNYAASASSNVIGGVQGNGNFLIATFACDLPANPAPNGTALYGITPMTLIMHTNAGAVGGLGYCVEVFALANAIGLATVTYTNNTASAGKITGMVTVLSNVVAVISSNSTFGADATAAFFANTIATTAVGDLIFDILWTGANTSGVTANSGQTLLQTYNLGAGAAIPTVSHMSMPATGAPTSEVVGLSASYGGLISLRLSTTLFASTFTGNGFGLTNLNATNLVGTIPSASLPNGGGLTTNVTIGTSTFYITNGLIMRITTP